MKINKIYQQIGILLIVIILLTSFISAFGVGAAYYKENPLKISAGETKEIKFNLQNGPGPDNIIARPNIIKGSEILELINPQDISVPVGSSIDVLARVTIPNDAKIGDVYPVEITFTTVTEGSSGNFGLGGSVGREFDVIIVPTAEEIAREEARLAEQKPIASWIIYLTIIIVILIILIIWIILKKKKIKKKG
jgi:hypothetical protein